MSSPPMRCNFLSTLLVLLSLFLCLAAARPDPSSPPELSNTTLDEISSLHQTTDASCVGHEGQWNCLYDTFQRCDGGRWTAALACSSQDGSVANKRDHTETHCAPLGRTDLVEFEGECSAAWGFGGGGGWNGGGGGGRTTCNGNGCYYGAGANLTVEKWWYIVVIGVVALGFL